MEIALFWTQCEHDKRYWWRNRCENNYNILKDYKLWVCLLLICIVFLLGYCHALPFLTSLYSFHQTSSAFLAFSTLKLQIGFTKENKNTCKMKMLRELKKKAFTITIDA